MDAGVGSSHEPCVLTPAVYLLDATRQKTPVVLLQLGIPNILRHSVTCVQIFMGHLPMLGPVTDICRKSNFSSYMFIYQQTHKMV